MDPNRPGRDPCGIGNSWPIPTHFGVDFPIAETFRGG
jgi:hypothetical protein